jgi:hypothetical protein
MKVALCAWAASSSPTARGAPHVRLKGTAHLDVHVARDGGEIVLSGRVLDDGSRPVLGGRIGVLFTASGAPIPLGEAAPRPCGGSDRPPEIEPTGQLAVVTDDLARFCVRVSLASIPFVAHIEARASGLVEGSALDVTVDPSRSALALRFDPEPSTLSLDDITTWVDAVASTDEGGATISAAALTLSLSNEMGMQLGNETTDASGRARFMVDGARLGPPGDGELRVTFAGGATIAASAHARRVERRTRVDLVAPDARERRLPIGWPEDGLVVRLNATPRCARLGCRETPTGMIEARLGDRGIVGAAPIERGEARLVMSFVSPTVEPFASAGSGVGEVPVTFRYLPNAPWFQTAGETVLLQPVRGPSPWRKLPLLLAATAVVGWLALVRTRNRPRRRRRAPPLPRPAIAGEQLQLVRAAPKSRGWTGRVTDAHDGQAIPQARVAIERPGFERIDIVVETVCDASGFFSLPTSETRTEDQLAIRSRLHATIRRPLPPCGELAVAVVLRRRALLDRLVAWARRRGTPYDASPEPTPRQVSRAAASDPGVEAWARAIEEAAYSGAVVDERVQAEVDRLAPPDEAKDDVDAARRRSV